MSEGYDTVPLSEVNLNRVGKKLGDSELKSFPYSAFGFSWNDGDDETTKFRPQGITGVTVDGHEFIAVSWYGRDDAGYANRGVRLSFMDVTNMDSFAYRHVLLVDENLKTFEGMHGGGVMHSDGLIHVPDSRSSTNKVYTFSLDNIQYIPEEDRDLFYDYAYIMPRSASYDVPTTPSFMAYDRDRKEAVLGTFYQCSSSHTDSEECLSQPKNRLMWYPIGQVNSSSKYCYPYYSEMQGAVSAGNPLSPEDHVLWSTSSYGSGHDSHLHIAHIDPSSCDAEITGITGNFRTIVYPPGLEDLYVGSYGSKYEDYLWIVTEFGASDGKSNTRVVFASKIQDLLP